MKATLKSSTASLSIKQQNFFSNLSNLQFSENVRLNVSSNRNTFNQENIQFVTSPKNKKVIHLGKGKRKHNQTDTPSISNNQIPEVMPSIPRVLKKSAQKDKNLSQSKASNIKEISMYDSQQYITQEDITPAQQTYKKKCFGRNMACTPYESLATSPNKLQQICEKLGSSDNLITAYNNKIPEKLNNFNLPVQYKITKDQSALNEQQKLIPETDIQIKHQKTESGQSSIYCSLGKIFCNYYQDAKKPKETFPISINSDFFDAQNGFNVASSLEATKYRMEKFHETRGHNEKENKFKNKKRVLSCEKILKKSLSSQKKSQHQRKAIQNLKKHRFIASYISNYELEKFYNKLILEGVPEQKWSIVIIDQVYKKIKHGKKQL